MIKILLYVTAGAYVGERVRLMGGESRQIVVNRGKLRNFYYGFTTFEKSNRKMSYKL